MTDCEFSEFPWNGIVINKDPPWPQNFITAKAGNAICPSFGATSCHALLSVPEAPKGLSGLGKGDLKEVFFSTSPWRMSLGLSGCAWHGIGSQTEHLCSGQAGLESGVRAWDNTSRQED